MTDSDKLFFDCIDDRINGLLKNIVSILENSFDVDSSIKSELLSKIDDVIQIKELFLRGLKPEPELINIMSVLKKSEFRYNIIGDLSFPPVLYIDHNLFQMALMLLHRRYKSCCVKLGYDGFFMSFNTPLSDNNEGSDTELNHLVEKLFSVQNITAEIKKESYDIRIGFPTLSGKYPAGGIVSKTGSNGCIYCFTENRDCQLEGLCVESVDIENFLSQKNLPENCVAVLWDQSLRGSKALSCLDILSADSSLSLIPFICAFEGRGKNLEKLVRERIRIPKSKILIVGEQPESLIKYLKKEIKEIHIKCVESAQGLKGIRNFKPDVVLISGDDMVSDGTELNQLMTEICHEKWKNRFPVIISMSKIEEKNVDLLSEFENVVIVPDWILDVKEFRERLIALFKGNSFLPVSVGMNVKKAQAFVFSNSGDGFKAEDVARSVNLSRDYLSRLFSYELGLSLQDYLLLLRTDLAKRMLSESQKSISEISELCGFSNRSYFSKVFLKLTGIRPTKFRQTRKTM